MTNTSLRLEHNQARNRRNITITCCKKTPMFPLSQAKSTNYFFFLRMTLLFMNLFLILRIYGFMSCLIKFIAQSIFKYFNRPK